MREIEELVVGEIPKEKLQKLTDVMDHFQLAPIYNLEVKFDGEGIVLNGRCKSWSDKKLAQDVAATFFKGNGWRISNQIQVD